MLAVDCVSACWSLARKNEFPACPQLAAQAFATLAWGALQFVKLAPRVVHVTVLSAVVAPALVNAAHDGSAPLPAVPAVVQIRISVPATFWMTCPSVTDVFLTMFQFGVLVERSPLSAAMPVASCHVTVPSVFFAPRVLTHVGSVTPVAPVPAVDAMQTKTRSEPTAGAVAGLIRLPHTLPAIVTHAVTA